MQRLRKSEALVALGVIALSAVAFEETWRIPVSPAYAQVGPTVMALAASGMMLALGIALLLQALSGAWVASEEEALTDFQPRQLTWVLLGLVLNVGLIGILGFIPASTLLFICVARAFGSRNMLRDAAIGLAFAAVAYFGFARALGINIGSGSLWEGLFP